MSFDTQPILQDDFVLLTPLLKEHFEELYCIASDPELWKFHPLNEGYRKELFIVFFEEALQTKALLIVDKSAGRTIGCTRFYNYNPLERSVVIGHTFFSQSYWGSGYNTHVKAMMLNYAFAKADKVVFYIVSNNMRSQKALEKLGAIHQGDTIRVYGKKELLCFIYEIKKKK